MAYAKKQFDETVMIAEGAHVVGEVTLGQYVNVWYNAVLRGDEGSITVGEKTNIQDGAILHEETVVGKGCTIGHNAIVHACTIGDNTLVGMGAIVLNGAKLADHCMVGAGSVVTGKMDAPAGSLLLGSPAKIVKELSAEAMAELELDAQNYIALAKKML